MITQFLELNSIPWLTNVKGNPKDLGSRSSRNIRYKFIYSRLHTFKFCFIGLVYLEWSWSIDSTFSASHRIWTICNKLKFEIYWIERMVFIAGQNVITLFCMFNDVIRGDYEGWRWLKGIVGHIWCHSSEGKGCGCTYQGCERTLTSSVESQFDLRLCQYTPQSSRNYVRPKNFHTTWFKDTSKAE